ncbi:hypothetical protein PIB30_062885 [Stylosanthes scabra]|uniref:Uncharacterized protein n=1 Tax=Stylosanthes scabra TaxID=79078 RepID=A0ABU6WJH4_9FABA|nr:hypothetical protein [Stylosanthes scabra]
MGGTNPVPNVLCIHNNVEPRSQHNSSKSRVTGKNSPWLDWASKRQGLGPCNNLDFDNLNEKEVLSPWTCFATVVHHHGHHRALPRDCQSADAVVVRVSPSSVITATVSEFHSADVHGGSFVAEECR